MDMDEDQPTGQQQQPNNNAARSSSPLAFPQTSSPIVANSLVGSQRNHAARKYSFKSCWCPCEHYYKALLRLWLSLKLLHQLEIDLKMANSRSLILPRLR